MVPSPQALRGLAVLIYVLLLLLNISYVRNNRLGEIKGFPEFPNYLIPYFRGGTRTAVFYTDGGG